MRIIGITGGVGSGKSEVLRYLNERWGAEILALDEVSRRLLDRDGAGYQKTVELFGRGILKEDGSVDRPAVAKLVFADTELREALNGIIHPLVKEETLVRIADARKRGVRLFVIEAALLIEGNYDAICDEMWYIHADAEVRAERLRRTRGYDDSRIRGVMAGQLSEEEFFAHCGQVIENGGDFADTRDEIDRLIQEIGA